MMRCGHEFLKSHLREKVISDCRDDDISKFSSVRAFQTRGPATVKAALSTVGG